MGRNWIPYTVVSSFLLLGVLLFSFRKSESTSERTINKPVTQIQNPVLKSTQEKSLPREVASMPVPNKALAAEDDKVDPLDTPILREKKNRAIKDNEILVSIQAEKRTELDLQFVGGGRWTVFSDLQVTREVAHQSLFSMGPFHVSRKGNHSIDGSMSLIYDENQKVLGVLTGRVVVKMKDNYDLNPIVKDYELKLENSSPEIRTAYLNTSTVEFAKLNESLKVDQRVERFYFEIVRTDWVKN